MSQPPAASGANDPVKPSRGHKKAGSGGSSGGSSSHGSSLGGGVGGLHRGSGGPKSKDSSALLMSVIRSLSASSDDHQQREQEKAKLDKAYSQSDERLGKLVSTHYSDLTTIVKVFGQVSSRITESRDKVRHVKENLTQCKMLLQCKREELKLLWIESLEQRTLVDLLSKIERVRDVPAQLEAFMKGKRYLHATELLVTSVNMLEHDLGEVDALRDLRSELHAKKEELHQVLIEELHRQIYIKAPSPVIRYFSQNGSILHQAAITGVGGVETLLSPLSVAPAMKSKLQGMGGGSAPGTPARKKPDNAEKATNNADESTAGEDDVDLLESLNADVDPEEDLHHFIAVLVESLSRLGKLPEAIEQIKAKMQNQLMAVISRSSQQVSDSTYVANSPTTAFNGGVPTPMTPGMATTPTPAASSAIPSSAPTAQQQQLLLELLELIFQQFLCIFQAHKLCYGELKKIHDQNAFSDLILYEMPHVWSKMQTVIQILLGDYLDVKNTAASTASSAAPPDLLAANANINAFFAKKRQTSRKKFPLFRFDSSSHAISMNRYLREQRQEVYAAGLSNDSPASSGGSGVDANATASVLGPEAATASLNHVCPPSASNIKVVFKPLQSFITQMEAATAQSQFSKSPPPPPLPSESAENSVGDSASALPTSTLHAFITDFVTNIFIGHVHAEVSKHIENATQGFDASLRTVVDQPTQRALCAPRPLLQSTVSVESSFQELRSLMKGMPAYGVQFLSMAARVLQNYKDTCFAYYKSLVMADSDDKRIISANWADDEDINRFLRCLPNWLNLKDFDYDDDSVLTLSLTTGGGAGGGGARLKTKSLDEPSQESVEEMRARNSKETEILTSNLGGDVMIPPSEILTDFHHLKTLAHLHESLEWFSRRIHLMRESLPDPSPETLANQHLVQVADDFQSLAETCLLTLHLEVRVHCFYYLLPVAKQSNYFGAIDDLDPDLNVSKLNKDLISIEEALTASLQPRKFKYVFEGLGHLVASILINSTPSLKRVNENGIKKMCRNIFAIQQNLTNITMSREADLDHARQYYEIMYQTVDDILNGIREQGAQFSELEYVNLLSLLHRSRTGSEDLHRAQVAKLKEILHSAILDV